MPVIAQEGRAPFGPGFAVSSGHVTELALSPAAVARSSSEALHRELDELHQMIYRRGGVRPVNAAIEELTKLLLLEVKHADDPDFEVPGWGPLRDVLDPDRIVAEGVKEAFRCVAALPDYAGRLPDGGTLPVWPEDEPFRLGRADVI